MTFPDIPNEILLLILEAVVEIEPKKAVELVKLSRDLQPFIERLLYRIISLVDSRQIHLFAELIRSALRPLSFYRDRIRHLCIAHEITSKDVIDIVSACKDVQILAIYSASGDAFPPEERLANHVALHSLLSPGGTVQPNRLAIPSLYLEMPVTSSLEIHCLQKVTHLELFCPTGSVSMEFNDTVLRHLPRLTHLSYLSLCDTSEASLFASSLTLSNQFTVCIIWVSTDETPTFLSQYRTHDPRVIIGTEIDRDPNLDLVLFRATSDTGIYLSDWGPRRSNEPDIWDLAEEIVERQRNGLVNNHIPIAR
ncbi:hypothetical protein C8J56DRAFT_916345 [Mycena floridula]|nr:hypothetical protein C8J56DRAFT_916345 [Mycena floridula]